MSKQGLNKGMVRPEKARFEKESLGERLSLSFRKSLVFSTIGGLLVTFALVIVSVTAQQQVLSKVLVVNLLEKTESTANVFNSMVQRYQLQQESAVVNFLATSPNVPQLVSQIPEERLGQEKEVAQGLGDPALANAFGLYTQLSFYQRHNNLDFLTAVDPQGLVLSRGSNSSAAADDTYLSLTSGDKNMKAMLALTLAGKRQNFLASADKPFLEKEGFVPQEVEGQEASAESPFATLSEWLASLKQNKGLAMVSLVPVQNDKGKIVGALVGGRFLNGRTEIFDELMSNLPEGSTVLGLAMGGELVSTSKVWKKFLIPGNQLTGLLSASKAETLEGSKFDEGPWWVSTNNGQERYLLLKKPIHQSMGLLTVGLPESLVVKVNHQLDNAKRNILFAVLGVMVLGLVGILPLNARMKRTISELLQKPLSHLTQTVGKIRESGDLSLRVSVSRRDELGLLAEQFNGMVESLADMVKSMDKLLQEIRQTSTAIDSGTAGIYQNAQEQSEGVTRQSAVLGSLVDSLGRVNGSSTEVKNLMESLSKESVRTLQEAGPAGEALGATVTGLHDMTVTCQNTSEAVKDLAEKSEQVNQVATFIREIAERTHLLALNSAVEAARAGEAGAGFAVVAKEIKVLAANVSTSVKQIEQLMSSIVANGLRSKDQATYTLDMAIANQGNAQKAQLAFDNLMAQLQNVVGKSQEIVSHTEIERQILTGALDHAGEVTTLMDRTQRQSGDIHNNAKSMAEISQRLRSYFKDQNT